MGFCRYLVRHKLLPKTTLIYAGWMYLRHVFLGLSLSHLHRAVFESTLKGRSLVFLERHVEPFLKQYLPSSLNHKVFARLKAAQSAGEKTLILSNSPAFLVSKFARYFGVDAWRSTEYALDSRGCLSGIRTLLNGEEKASSALKLAESWGILLKDVVAYSDSHWDLPLLQIVGRAVAVNPDRKLSRVALVRGWEIL